MGKHTVEGWGRWRRQPSSGSALPGRSPGRPPGSRTSGPCLFFFFCWTGVGRLVGKRDFSMVEKGKKETSKLLIGKKK